MSGTDGWSSVPRRESGPVDDPSGQEARGASPTSAAGRADGDTSTRRDGRVHGRPAPHYGEYAPEGWVNPVLVEQERQDREERSRALREQAAAEAVRGGHTIRGAGSRTSSDVGPAGRHDQGAEPSTGGAPRTAPASRFGKTPGDFIATVALLAFGLVSVLQSLAVRDVAATVRRTLETQYTALTDPSGLGVAAVVGALTNLVVFVLVAWWSVRRLRARRRTFWVPLLGAVVATLVSTIAFVVVVFQDPHFVEFMLRQAGGA
ncbi:DUF6264 family protein [Curtobacterium sp. MCLR17_036]|uniref:DUF6264 family protein n=1 Tax=Curtobacterium sp. MCLR17_036 TaxID=2175620 RepID=UPI000DAA7CB2|nr:DUF6264 family protein [Curtobacterium sp. MCLR17_036]WIE65754.1 DUF6264 family protein [Curtobacterium sp. MCLR17_036]